jgi:hypothetical protein
MVLISMLLTLGVVLWFYRTAEKRGANAVQWAVAGAIAYQVPAWAWKLLVSKPYLDSIRGVAAKTTMGSNLIGHSWVLIGAVCALAVYKFVLMKSDVKAE